MTPEVKFAVDDALRSPLNCARDEKVFTPENVWFPLRKATFVESAASAMELLGSVTEPAVTVKPLDAVRRPATVAVPRMVALFAEKFWRVEEA